MDKKEIFFAYESNHQECRDAINRAVEEFNQYQKQYKAGTWEELDIGGRIINKAVLDAIERCDLFACDLTYLNHNVLFELGFAIGQKKKLLIFVNETVATASANYSALKILRNIGHRRYKTHKEILNELRNKTTAHKFLLNEITTLKETEKDVFQLFYIKSNIETQAALELTELLHYSDYKVIYNDTSEVEYQTLTYYINALHRCQNTIIHLLGHGNAETAIRNAESSFYAGIASGFGKQVLLVAPAPFRAPIDYTDILIEYSSSTECAISTEEWLKRQINQFNTKRVQQTIAQQEPEDAKYNLLKLGIGEEVAEEEIQELSKYFIEFEAYKKAKEQSISVFTGRKGTGKSALFIKLEQEMREEENTYNLVFKPESDELLDNIEISKLFTSERGKKTFFLAVWKFVFYTKLLSSIYREIDRRISSTFSPTEKEEAILNAYVAHKPYINLNFFGAMRQISTSLNESLTDKPELLESLFRNILSPTISAVRQYLSGRRYMKLNFIADNLDKTWDPKHDLGLQAEMILSLLEYSGRFVAELDTRTKEPIKVSSIVFLRKDIFEYVLKESREPDKLLVRNYEIDWSKHPNLLRKIIEARFRNFLSLEHETEVQDVWTKYFKLPNSEHPYSIISQIAVPRPRDTIYFFKKLFESAVNNDNSAVEAVDLQYTVEVYSKFIQQNLIAEMRAEYPNISEILDTVEREFSERPLEYHEFRSICLQFVPHDHDFHKLLEALIERDYLIGINETMNNEMLKSIGSIKRALSMRRFFFFKHKVIIELNPRIKSFNRDYPLQTDAPPIA